MDKEQIKKYQCEFKDKDDCPRKFHCCGATNICGKYSPEVNPFDSLLTRRNYV